MAKSRGGTFRVDVPLGTDKACVDCVPRVSVGRWARPGGWMTNQFHSWRLRS